jgi:GPI inositol-deacylase
VTSTFLFFLAIYAGVYGVTYAYLLHHLVNVIAAWLLAIHFSTSKISLTGLSLMLDGDDLGLEEPKKRP